MIKFKHKGDFSNLEKFLERSAGGVPVRILDRYGQEGVRALSSATPKDTGKTSESWYYKTEKKNGVLKIIFCNSNIQNEVMIAIILQYGHVAKNGVWIQGRDYINPAIQPIFDKMAAMAWEEVKKR